MSIHEDWKEPGAPRQGMSTGLKVLLIAGGVGGVICLLCCGGVALFLFKAGDMLKEFVANAASNDPTEIRARTRKIVQIDVPPGYEPSASMDIGFMQTVTYEKAGAHASTLTLVSMGGGMLPGADMSQHREEMLKQMREGHVRPDLDEVADEDEDAEHAEVKVQERETRTLNVCGKPTEFEFAKGTSSDGNSAVRMVTGAFDTSKGFVTLALVVPEQDYDEAAVLKMLESIKDPDDLAAAPPATTESPAEHAPATEGQPDAGKEPAGEPKPDAVALPEEAEVAPPQ